MISSVSHQLFQVNCLFCSHSLLSKQHVVPIDCKRLLLVITRNDHTKVDLDQARLFPTDDVDNV